MCTLYAGIYRVALRLQRAAEARRSRTAASLVSVASHAITHITHMSAGSLAVPPLTATATRFPDVTDSSAGLTAVAAELHSNNAGEDQLKPISSDQSESFASKRTTNNEDEPHAEAREDCDGRTATVSCQLENAADRAKQQTEVTPLLEHSVDSDRRALNNSDVRSTSGIDGSRLPVTRMASKCRQRWLVVLPDDDDDEVEECGPSNAAMNGRRYDKTAVRRSVDVGRKRVRVRTRSTRGSLLELPTYRDISTVTVLAGRSTSSSTSSSSSVEFGCQSQLNNPAEIAPASGELTNAVNDVIDVAITCSEQVGSHCCPSPEHPQNQSVGLERLSADKNQPALEAATTMTSFVGKCDDRGADSCCTRGIVWAARHEQQQQQQAKINENAEKNDDAISANKSVRRMADRWRRRAQSRFMANRRFAHLRQWKTQRRFAGHTPTSSVDGRHLLVSTAHYYVLASFATMIL